MAKRMAAEKPKIELIQSNELFNVDFCAPVKDKVEICGPNIVVKPCQPIIGAKCLPEIIRICGPLIVCEPTKPVCEPIKPITEICAPSLVCGPHIRCGPWVEGPCGPSVIIDPIKVVVDPIIEVVNQLNTRIQELTKEVQALKK